MIINISKGKKEIPEKAQADSSARMLEENQNVFKQFLPIELLAMMGMENKFVDSDKLFREQKELQAVILNANIVGFQERIHHMQMQEVYRFINQTLSFSIPVIYENNGMVVCFQDAGVVALFTGAMEDGLQAGILICEAVIKAAEKKQYENFAVGLCCGSVMAGVVGHEKRLSVLTLSPYMGLSAFLQKTALKYYTRILVTGSYVENMKGFDKGYNHRFLGYFYIRDMGCAEKVFDIFDGDETAVRNRKRKTRLLFEKGVGLFVKREFSQARGYFIEVLKADRQDRAAREYVFLCDRYRGMSAGEAAGANIFIETC